MMWAAIAYDGKSEIVFLICRQNSFDYSLVLENSLLPFAWQYSGLDTDNASIPISNAIKDWLDEQDTVLLGHRPISPDLNPIENVWRQLVRMVYANGVQYTSLVDLKLQSVKSRN